jgi:hypothetical protein
VIEGGAEDSTLPRRDRSDGLVARPSSSPDTTAGMRGLVRCRDRAGATLSLLDRVGRVVLWGSVNEKLT